MSCAHEDFDAQVTVTPLVDAEGQDVNTYMADIRVKCADCGEPFGWRGVTPGISLDGVRVSLDGLELRAAMRSPAELALMDVLPGFDPGFVPPGVPRGVDMQGPEQ